jgi:hypothetical protein
MRRAATIPATSRSWWWAARLFGSLLIRDNPSSTFTPTVPSGPRPFALPAFAPRTTPFLLAPGQAVKIAVIAQPTRLGVRDAMIRVEAVAVGAPASLRATAVVRAEALQGPQLHWLPGFLWFNRDPTDSQAETRRTVMIDNVGSYDLDVTQLQITGRDAARFSFQSLRGLPPLRLRPADYDDIWVTYTPVCGGSYADHEATLVVNSNGGRAELRLTGNSYGFCELP